LTSSPGTPQGLALYMQGIRVNETSGDTVNWDIPRNAEGEAHRSAEPATRRQVHPCCALYRDSRKRGLRGRARSHRREGLDRLGQRHLLSPSPGLRDTKKRRPPAPLPRRLLAHLRRWKRAGQRFAVEWNGAPVRDVDKAFRNVAREAGLPDVTPHILRHTAATWQMQLGTDPWQAAEYLGMTLKTLLDNYGHHHPDYLKGPREAFDRAPKLRQNNATNERERTQSNVMKIADRSR